MINYYVVRKSYTHQRTYTPDYILTAPLIKDIPFLIRFYGRIGDHATGFMCNWKRYMPWAGRYYLETCINCCDIFEYYFYTLSPQVMFSCILHYCCMAMRTGTHTPLPHDVICGRAPTYFSRGYPFSHEELDGLYGMPAPCLEALLICLPL